jgi:hypothetical protein
MVHNKSLTPPPQRYVICGRPLYEKLKKEEVVQELFNFLEDSNPLQSHYIKGSCQRRKIFPATTSR